MDKIDKSLFEFADKGDLIIEEIQGNSLSFWQDARIRFSKNKAALLSLILFLVFLLIAVSAPFVGTYHNKYYTTSACQTQYDNEGEVDSNCKLDGNMIGARNMLEYGQLPPKIPFLSSLGIVDGVVDGVDVYEEAGVPDDMYFLFGTDDLGRDLYVRTMIGSLVSIGFGFCAALIDLFIGVSLGGVSGYFGGKLDLLLQRIVEIIGSVPRLIWVVILVTIIGSGFVPLLLALVISGWISMYRIVRSQMLKLKEQEFVLSARTLGSSDSFIIRKHLLPNAMGVIIVWLMFSIPSAIFFESFMSFIGLGISAPIPSLGTLASEGRQFLTHSPYILFIPSIVLSIIMLMFNLIADGLRDAFDPKMRGGE